MKEKPDLSDRNKSSQGFIQAIFEPLIQVIGKLPPPLAYGGVIIIALLAVVIARGLIQNSILWAVLSIFVIAISSYVFLELRTKTRKRRRSTAVSKTERNIQDRGTNKIRFEQIKPQKMIKGEFTDYVTLGRNPVSLLSFPETEPKISWDHGIIRFVKGEYIYEHRSDSHPTKILSNDGSSRLMRAKRKESSSLRNQDRLIIGNYEIIVTFDIEGTRIPTYIPTTE